MQKLSERNGRRRVLQQAAKHCAGFRVRIDVSAGIHTLHSRLVDVGQNRSRQVVERQLNRGFGIACNIEQVFYILIARVDKPRAAETGHTLCQSRQFFRCTERCRFIPKIRRQTECALPTRFDQEFPHPLCLIRRGCTFVIRAHDLAPDRAVSDEHRDIHDSGLLVERKHEFLDEVRAVSIRTEDRCCYALGNLIRNECRIGRVLEIDETRRNDHAFHIEKSLTRSRSEHSDIRDFSVANSDVAERARFAGAVDNRAVHQDEIFGPRVRREKEREKEKPDDAHVTLCGIMSSQQVPRKEDILFMTVPELRQLLRMRKISCKELTASYIERIRQIDSKLNSFVTVTEDRARQEAERVDREIEHGTDLGPLHGIPYAVKDLFATRGIPTRWGSRLFANQVFEYDATVVTRLRDAGAVLLGKLNMIELAGGTGYKYASASAAGATHNPWDLSRWAGGSSSGSGAAVAAGLVAFAMGSETWGSIVVPSAFCGITGFRPSYSRVSRYGVMANAWTLDKVGPMARSAEDCMLVMNAINGIDPKDPTVRVSWRYKPPTKPVRIGVFQQSPSSVSKPVADAVDVLKKNGHDIREIKLPPLPYSEVISIIQRAEACAAFWPLIRDGRLNQLSDEGLKTSFAAGVNIRAVDYLQANRVRAQMEEAMKDVTAEVNVIVAPTLPFTANNLEDDLDKAFGQLDDSLGAVGNLLGWPALSVPCGFSDGLPLGMLILGAYGREDDVVNVALDYQRLTDWHKRRPPL